MTKEESFVSVVMAVRDEAGALPDILRKLQAVLAAAFVDYEIVVVDQRSSDRTAEAVQALLPTVPSIRLLELAYPVHHDVAVSAALENAIGDFVVILSPRRDPIGCVQDVVRLCRGGADIVVGVAPQHASLGYRLIRPFVSRLVKSIGYNLPRNATSLRCLSRRAVNAVTRAGKFHHQFFVRVQKTGYPSAEYEYRLLQDGRERTLLKGAWETARLLVFNSMRPLRWMSALGLGGSAIAFLATLYGVGSSLLGDGRISPMMLLAMFVSVMFAVLFTMLAFFGEYLGRLLDEQGGEALYSVIRERHSTVMVDEGRVNVLHVSASAEASR